MQFLDKSAIWFTFIWLRFNQELHKRFLAIFYYTYQIAFQAFATSFAIVLNCILAYFLFNFRPTMFFVVGACFVIGAVFVYSIYPYRSAFTFSYTLSVSTKSFLKRLVSGCSPYQSSILRRLVAA